MAGSSPTPTTQRAGTPALVLDLARRQHGTVARRQLLELGLTPRLVASYLATGRLVPVATGVYCPGHDVLGRHGRWMAGVLSAGDEAVLSHKSAGAHWGLLRPIDEVEVVRRFNRTKPKPARHEDPCRTTDRTREIRITVHRSRTLPAADLTSRDGIPVTTVARTLLDLAGSLTMARLESALIEAERLRLVEGESMSRVARRGRGWKGVANLRELLDRWNPVQLETKSELESAFVRLCDRAGIASPQVNVTVEGAEVDCLWPAARLIVELDGFSYHRDRARFENDRRRDAVLQKAGFSVLRFTHRMVRESPDEVAGSVLVMLQSGPQPEPVSDPPARLIRQ